MTLTDTHFPYTALFRSARLETLCRPLAGCGLLQMDGQRFTLSATSAAQLSPERPGYLGELLRLSPGLVDNWPALADVVRGPEPPHPVDRSEEPTSELPSLMRISYAVFCLQKKTIN